METKVHLYMPWQGLQILILSWSQGPWIREHLQASIFPRSIKHGAVWQYLHLQIRWRGATKKVSHEGRYHFFLFWSFIPTFAEGPSSPCHYFLESCHSHQKGCAFPFQGPKTLSLFVWRPVWYIQYWADSQSRHSAESGQAVRADILGSLSKAPKISFLGVSNASQHDGSHHHMPAPSQHTEESGSVVNSLQALRKLKVIPLELH